MATAKPVIFISYSHKDEPDKPVDGETKWLSFVRTFLQPAVKEGIFDLWDDRDMTGGTDWDPAIEQKLRACDIFILPVSANSMASDYIIDKEIAITRGLIDDAPPRPVAPDAAVTARLADEARANLAAARKLITDCGYHRRDEELAELEARRDGKRRFADLPPRV